jgi:hypothetical protein
MEGSKKNIARASNNRQLIMSTFNPLQFVDG